MNGFLIMLGAGAILAGFGLVSYGLLKREQRHSTRRIKLLARLIRYANESRTGGRAAGYYPGSLADPRD